MPTNGRLAYPQTAIRVTTPDAPPVRLGHTIEFALAGEIDLSNAAHLSAELDRALDHATRTQGRPARLLLDLRNLEFIDSAGIQALLGAERRCVQQGTRFALRLGDSRIRHVLTVAGMAELLLAADTTEAL